MTSRRHFAPWPFLSLIPLGLGAWAPIYAGARARRPRWTALGILWSAVVLLGWVLAADSNGSSGFAGVLIILGWAGAVASSFTIRRPFELAIGLGSGPSSLERVEREAETRLHARAEARRIAQQDPGLALEMGIGRPDRPGGADTGLVDVNHATAHELTTLPAVDAALAQRIVATRAQVHAFSSLEDLGTVMDLDGDLVEQLRERAIFITRAG